MSSSLLNTLIDRLRVLPTVGPRSARRMALHLLQSDRAGGVKLSQALADAMTNINNCQQCQNFTEQTLCGVCSDQERDRSLLCVVENPADVDVIEMASDYQGYYFVLMGRLSPLDGIGPDDLGMEKLFELIRSVGVNEVILATSTSVEGDATAYYISDQLVNDDLKVTRLMTGMSAGSELEAISGSMLKQAFTLRQPFPASA
ncbi:recombination mediator RecR [Litoribrevibacter albus]|uniref:Recombination protein RecR n=1 Tax=Litoribrevibacter albus TaxID=1473156 RepID=A0AA37S858_9GAMM|nr:recombination mediator RecR [Litoribrevibacter albus]GLQ30031.1 recombination protein RecR [Litoribrevibacter albus]